MDCDFYKKLITEAPFAYAYHRIILNDSGEPIDYEFLEVNESFLKMTELNPENILNKKASEIIGSFENEEKDWFNLCCEVAINGGCREISRYFNCLKKSFNIRLFSSEKFFFSAMFIDNTEENKLNLSLIEKQKSIENLCESEEKYKVLTDFISDVLWVLDLSTMKFTFISKSIFNLRGFTVKEALSQNFEESFTPQSLDYVKQTIKENLDEFINNPDFKNYYVTQFQQPRKDGSVVWVEVSAKFRYNTAKGIEIVGVSRNIEERKNIEQNLRNAKEKAEEASRVKSEFVANMSHEIRTPLNAVIGFSDMLMKTELNQVQKQYADNVNTSANALLDIINDILDFSKIEAGKLELEEVKTDIIELVEKTADIIKYNMGSKGLEFILNIDTKTPRFAIVDPIRLKQILVNLLSNAVKFTITGEIELAVNFNPKKGAKNIGFFNFYVRDTGIGIEESQQKKLFKSFSQADTSITRKFGGTGLGLVISNMLAEKMGGFITLESKIQKGTKFSFTIEKEYYENEEKENRFFERIKSVLIADDNRENRIILQNMLENWNIKTLGVNNGLSVLDILAKPNDFDALVIDYNMPYLNGLETLGMIREKLKIQKDALPAILLYTSFEESFLKKENDEKYEKYKIIKPVKKNEIYNVLKNIDEMQIFSVEKKEIKLCPISRMGKEDTILIADDVVMNMMLIKSMIENILPCSLVIEAKNGGEAVDKAKSLNPDIIFMDIQMPIKDGYEATKEIREYEVSKGNKRIPIIALTATSVRGEKERCEEAGMDDYLTKPIKSSVIEETIKKYLRKENDGDMENNLTANDKDNFEKIEKNDDLHFEKDKLMERVAGNSTLFKNMIEVALLQWELDLENLLNYIKIEDLKEIKSFSHKIKGSALTMECKKLAEISKEMEIAEDFNRIKMIETYDRLKEELSVLKKVFNEL